MKLHFEPNLQYQLDAIDSVSRLFEGAPRVRSRDTILAEVHANILKLAPERILRNRDDIMGLRRIADSDAHKTDEMDFSIEMETGTGKTYVYLRTIFELNRSYGLSKFIIVVPSIPVKEGALKTLEITKQHFKGLYSVPFEYFAYDSKKLTQVKSFCEANTLQIMVMNIQAFNAEDRVISQERDATHGVRMIDLIKQTYPVIIMDEPQVGMGTTRAEHALSKLNPLFKLRYSATHEVPKNVIYRLTPFDAYNQGLVKKIEVFSVKSEGIVESMVFKDAVFAGRKPPQAKLIINTHIKDKGFKSKTITCKANDDLEQKTNNPAYRGLVIERIWRDMNDGQTKLQFNGGAVLIKGEQTGSNKEQIFTEQIRRTIEKHFAKKDEFNSKGIKILSLFFIDRVANYVDEDGLIKQLFCKLYKELYKKRYGKSPADMESIHNGYFAKTSSGEWTDNEVSMKKNSEAYQLILKDKERLLSLEEPLEFIFSHSALGVGWDNPNVFNICALNETLSSTKKRQEIGRGLRICVNQNGERVHDPLDVVEGKETNLLTVIANQSYQEFAEQYQTELIEEYGPGVKTIKLRNAKQQPDKIKLNKARFESNDFSELWKRIAKKTKWSVSFHEPSVINLCVEVVRSIQVPEPTINVELNRITTLGREGAPQIWNEYVGSSAPITAKGMRASLDPINEISDQTGLALDTVREILQKAGNPQNVTKNPIAFMAETIERIKYVLDRELVKVVRYETIKDTHDKSLFEELYSTYADTIPTPNHGLYDKERVDSGIEKQFGAELDNDSQIRLFFKLPKWYSIPTPIGNHHPDWAIVMEKRALDEGGKQTKYYYVVETKGTRAMDTLSPDERINIQCAMKHFEAVGLKEYLAPVDTFDYFKQEVND
ncbi:MAG: DEAD/DEAH box helicase family protein [Patescibacteria group bacterium]|jgi:type III restriction enzyme